MKKLDTIELFIDEENIKDGIDAISLVKMPAIEENFVALNQHRIEFKSIDDDKRIIIGLALVPDKLIYRRNGDYEYNIVFSKETVKKAAELYFKKLKNNNATLEHQEKTDGVSTIESWIVENPKIDKSALYNLNATEGSWVVIMKIDNDEVWKEVKNGTYLGLSVEGYFSDKLEMSSITQESKEQELIEKIKELLLNAEKKTSLETYNDYPQQAIENAKIALRYAEENGWGSCGTPVGKARANQLANGENISEETIARMASFERQRQNSNKELGDGCGRLMWLAWGGDAGIEWAQRKLEQIRKDK